MWRPEVINIHCTFTRLFASQVQCTQCGFVLHTTSPPERCFRNCPSSREPPATSHQQLATKPPPPATDCLHRGELLATRTCDLCSIKGQPFEVYQCALHGECSLGKKHSLVRSCLVCPDRQPTSHQQLATSNQRATIGVIIPTYNCGPYLAECIRSLRAQTRPPDRLIVVDDGSTDGTAELLQTLVEQFDIEIISHEINRGANAARQTGIEQLDTTWMLLADADATYHPSYLERLAETADAQPEADLVYCSLTRQREGTDRIEQIRIRPWQPQLLWWTNYISMGTLIRRAAFLEVIGRMESQAVHLDGLDDWALWLKFAAAGRTGAHVDTPLIHAWERAQGKTGKLRADPTALRREIAHHRRQHAQLIGCREPISIVIPYLNCSDLLTTCLEHVRDYCGLPYEVIIVDNGSAEPIPDVAGVDPIVIRNARNLGFTKACNQGFRVSQNRHVLLLNSDCFIGPDCVEKLYHHLQSGERIAAVGPRTNDGGHQSLTPGQRETLSALAGARRCAGPPRAIPQRMLAFFCTLISREAIQAIGPQDSRPVFESGLGADDEWCHRANQAGWRCLLADDAFAQHLGSQSFRRNNIDRDALQRPAIAEILRLTASS